MISFWLRFASLVLFCIVAFGQDYVSNEIGGISEDVESNFIDQPKIDIQRKKLLNALARSYYTPVTMSQLPVTLPPHLQRLHSPASKSPPSLQQIVYLLRNRQNPMPRALTRARVELIGNSGVSGIINLKQMKNGPVMIFGTIQGLPRQGKFGFHFHELPVEGLDCESAGEHYNPYGMRHGDKDNEESHLGDLGNVSADYDGTSHIILTNAKISLGNHNSVIGRSLVIHLYEDDLGQGRNYESSNSGNSGPRLACGTVTLIPPTLDAEENPN